MVEVSSMTLVPRPLSFASANSRPLEIFAAEMSAMESTVRRIVNRAEALP
jgi:hypothetical protein